jgi:hypothetical protein
MEARGNVRSLTEVLSTHFFGGAEENQGDFTRISGNLPGIRTKYLPYMSLERDRYTNRLGRKNWDELHASECRVWNKLTHWNAEVPLF